MGGIGSGRKPRTYPPEVVDLVCGLYLAGKTIAEIKPYAIGYRAQTILERYLPGRRKAIKRNQNGPANHMWKDSPGYQAAHLRVEADKGKASEHVCADCGSPAHDWSYVHGCPDELRESHRPAYCTHPNHYEPRCRTCHRAYDRRR